ncbi:uncharacterized protein LOC133392290 [Anopheles gambiae]|uniref:uncharacterized protein LOC133392290 n=1 Tax=Anopheles gambiae TaxID=7165 RepID=UPI002AC89D2C|nr:uncharacterized protein LOC133392290 [Anopheles gambiae]
MSYNLRSGISNEKTMEPSISKDKMMGVLKEVGETVPESASITQVRRLFDATHTESKMATIQTTPSSLEFETCAEAASGNTEASASTIETLTAKLKQLKLEKEVSLLKQEMANMKQIQQPLPLDTIKCIEGLVDSFSGEKNENAECWIKQLEQTFQLFNVNELEKIIITRRLLNGTAAMLTKYIVFTSYDELKQQILENFSTKPSPESVYHQLRRRQLLPQESTIRYVLEMENIAKNATISEQELVSIIIDGIGDPVNAAAIRFSANSLTELKTALQKYESIRLQPVSVSFKPRIMTRPDNVGGIKCYNCSNYGHHQRDCQQPRRRNGSCFLCGNMGHVARDCTHRTQSTSAAIYHSEANQNNVIHEPNYNESAVQIEAIQEP